jgi:ABC-type branched-subunit amino acid transport system ATPase component
MGIARIPEGGVWPGLTVGELGAGASRGRRVRGRNHGRSISALSRLKAPKPIAGTLSGGEQQMLAIGEGSFPPKLLILDEPSLGWPLLVSNIFENIQKINQQG